ncbi:MAG: F420-nonreducing hydrogenase [Mycobacterium leprae]
MTEKLKFAFYWGASCGGCEVTVLDINEKILDVAALADIVLWPVAVDGKYADVEAMPDESIDVAFVNGAVRNEDNLRMARLLRQKAKTVVAFGACAIMGGIPGLANFHDRESIFQRVYADNAVNPEGTRPQTHTAVPEGELELPAFYNTVFPLADVIAVDYFVPGCPPLPATVVAAVQAIAVGQLPPKGSMIGGGNSTVCQTCDRRKEEKKVREFKRIAFVTPEPERCLLEQGLVCLGSVTRDGCGGLCLKANMPCRGCFGAPGGVVDQGARFLSALSTLVDADEPREIDQILAGVDDPLGYAYRFSLPGSLLKRKAQRQVTIEEVGKP